MSRPAYEELKKALLATGEARSYIAQNRGYEKDQAREGYECAVGEVLVPALDAALDLAVGDVEAKDVESLAHALLKLLSKRGLV